MTEYQKKIRGQFSIFYPIDYHSDAETILDYALYAQTTVENFFPEEIKLNSNVRILMSKKPTESLIRLRWLEMRNDYNNRIIFLNSPSKAYEYDSQYDNIWYKANLIHEYVHIVVAEFIRPNTNHDMYKYFPKWFSEGIAGYIPYYHSSEEIMERYEPKLNNIKQIIRNCINDFEVVNQNIYYGGALIIKYMYDTYESSIINFMRGIAPNWKESLRQNLNVTYADFKEEWVTWTQSL